MFIECTQCGKKVSIDQASDRRCPECAFAGIDEVPMCEHGNIDNYCDACMYAANE